MTFACALAAGGCGGAATIIDPSDLRPPSVSRAIRLDEDYTFENRLGGINNVLARVTILSGRYQAQYEDAGGVYFLGPKACFKAVYVDSDAPSTVVDCGIYMPNDKGLDPRIYIYRNQPAQTADTTSLATQATPKGAPVAAGAAGAAISGAIVDVIIASDQGKPRFMGQKLQPPGAEFRARLRSE